MSTYVIRSDIIWGNLRFINYRAVYANIKMSYCLQTKLINEGKKNECRIKTPHVNNIFINYKLQDVKHTMMPLILKFLVFFYFFFIYMLHN